MKLSIRLFFLCSIFGFLSGFSQEQNSKENEQEKQYQIFHFYAGLNHNSTIGDGFIADAYTLQTGGEVGGDFMISKHIFGGFQFDFLKANALEPEKLAGVKHTRIVSSSLHLGYKFYLGEKYNLSLRVGLGHARYANEPKMGKTFHDDAFFMYTQSRLAWLFTNNWSLYLAAAVRHDNLKIETSPDFQEYFNNSTRIPVSVGVLLSL